MKSVATFVLDLIDPVLNTSPYSQYYLTSTLTWTPNKAIAGKHCYARMIHCGYTRDASFDSKYLYVITCSLPQLCSSFSSNYVVTASNKWVVPAIFPTQTNGQLTHNTNRVIGIIDSTSIGGQEVYPQFLTYVNFGPQEITFNLAWNRSQVLGSANDALFIMMEFEPVD